MLPAGTGTAAAADASMPESATALDIPSDSARPPFVQYFMHSGIPAAATAVRLPTPPDQIPTMYLTLVRSPPPTPEQTLLSQRHAYACITPADSPFRADPGPFVRRVFRTLALDLPQTFELLTPSPLGDVKVRFRTPGQREAAMRRQPFALDGATVRLVREGGARAAPVVFTRAPADLAALVALRGYPVEQRTEKKIRDYCWMFGLLREVDPACFAAPDLAPVRAVLQIEDARQIPREIWLDYFDGSTSVIPVEIVSVWHRSFSYGADGRYVRLFQQPPAAAA